MTILVRVLVLVIVLLPIFYSELLDFVDLAGAGESRTLFVCMAVSSRLVLTKPPAFLYHSMSAFELLTREAHDRVLRGQ